jgi:hypothetical protein
MEMMGHVYDVANFFTLGLLEGPDGERIGRSREAFYDQLRRRRDGAGLPFQTIQRREDSWTLARDELKPLPRGSHFSPSFLRVVKSSDLGASWQTT